MSHRVLIINSVAMYGSTGKIASQIGELAKANGWECFLAYRKKDSQPSPLINIPLGGKLDFYFHAFASTFFDSHGLASITNTFKLIKQIRDINPSIIHLHNIHGYFLNYRILFTYLQKIKVPIIWTLHDCWIFTGHCAYFDSIDCDKWKDKCTSCLLKKDYPKSLFIDQSKRNFLLKKKMFTGLDNVTLVPVSHWLESLTKQSFLKMHSIQTIHNGIDLNTFKPTESSLKELYKLSDASIVLGVSSKGFGGRKGLSDFIYLANNLPANYKLIMIGVHPNEIKVIPSNVITIERTNSQRELACFYSIADVFINPTYSDNFPTTNIEALACGTPVITYNTGGSPESLTEEVGIVVERGNRAELLSAIMKLCDKDLEQKGITREKCRTRAVSLFDKNDRFNDYLQLYQKCVNSAR